MMSVVGLRSVNIIVGDFSHPLLVLRAILSMRMGHYNKDSQQSCIWFQMEAGICVIPMAKALTTVR